MAEKDCNDVESAPICSKELIKALKASADGMLELHAIFCAIKDGGEAEPVDLAAAGRRISNDVYADSCEVLERVEKSGLWA